MHDIIKIIDFFFLIQLLQQVGEWGFKPWFSLRRLGNATELQGTWQNKIIVMPKIFGDVFCGILGEILKRSLHFRKWIWI
jgi:hypothetical protein